jgi:hypothetical protein
MRRLSEILRSEVVTESGESLGHVFDVRVARSPRSSTQRADQDWHLTGLVVGRRGFSERFGFARNQLAGPRHTPDAVPWEDVLRFEDERIVVRAGAERA